MNNGVTVARIRIMDGDRCKYTLPVRQNGAQAAAARAASIAARLEAETGRKMTIEPYTDTANK